MLVVTLAVMAGAGYRVVAADTAGILRKVPGNWEAPGEVWGRCWVKVPDHWTVMTGRPLYRESVTVTIPEGAGVHEIFVNARRIGGAGTFPPETGEPETGEPEAGHHRYKVPAGTLLKGQWNELAVRLYQAGGEGGFRNAAPSIQGYFLECVLAGDWEVRVGGDEEIPGAALVGKPSAAAFSHFHEASRVLGEAAELMPGRRLPPDESLRLMKTEEDLIVDQLLTEPLVAQPTHLSFDARGRLWVSQYRQYPYPAGLRQISRDKYYRAKYDDVPKAPPHHNRGRSRISIHEDRDGDGRYETHNVFLDGLDLANAALPARDGVWVMHTPYLLFYPDRDGDDVPDGDPEVHLAGFGFEDTHSVANGLIWGPAGWIYGGQGSTVASRVVRPGLDEESGGVYFEGCMAWRYHPPTKRFEIFAEGGGNVFGLEFDSDGRLFSGHNGGDTRGWHYVPGGYLLKQGRTPNKFGPPANPYAFGDLAMMRSANPIPRFSHATIVCEGSAMPTRLRGAFLAADPLHHFLILSERQRRGSTFETKDVGRPLISEDEAFRPVYLCNAPDGSVFVADFYEEYIAHGQHYQSQIDPSSGRVYRLRGRGQVLEEPVDLRALENDELITLLDHPNKWHRQTAVRILGERGPGEGWAEKLVAWIREHAGRPALDGFWALAQGGGFDPALTKDFLNHPYAPLRAWTVRLAGERLQHDARELALFRELARREDDLEVWSQLASTAQRLDSEAALPVVGNLLRRAGALEDPNLPLMLWWAIEKHCEDREDVLKLFSDPVIREQSMVRDEILPRVMRRYATAGGHENLAVCAKLFRLASDAAERKAFLAGFEKAFEGGPLPSLPDELLETLAEAGSLSLMIRLRRGDEEAVDDAVKIASDEAAPPAKRLRMVKALGEIGARGAQQPLLELATAGGGDRAVQVAALAALKQFAAPAIASDVLKVYGGFGEEARRAADALLASREPWAKQWLAAIEGEIMEPETIGGEAVAVLRRYRSEPLASLVNQLFGEAPSGQAPAAGEVERIRKVIADAPGNPYRGRPIFKQRCASCHVLFHSGGRIGPDLTSYQRDDLDTMLTSIIDPGAEIREGYEAYSVETGDGRHLAGFVLDRGQRYLVLRGFDGSDTSLPRENIEKMTPLGRSLMPTGLIDGLSDQEVRDLFAYLRISQPFLSD